MQINGLLIKGGIRTVAIDDDEDVTLTVPVAEDPRRVVLTRPIDEWDPMIRGTVTVCTTGATVSFKMLGPEIGPLVFPRLSEAVAETLIGPSASLAAPATGTTTVGAPAACVPDTDVPWVSVRVTVMVSDGVEFGSRLTGTPTLAPFWTAS